MNTFLVAFCVALCLTVTFGQALGPCIGDACPSGYTCQSQMCVVSGGGTSTPTCVDKRNAQGVNECPSKSYLCTNPLYVTLMTQQCPKTCNRCTTSG